MQNSTLAKPRVNDSHHGITPVEVQPQYNLPSNRAASFQADSPTTGHKCEGVHALPLEGESSSTFWSTNCLIRASKSTYMVFFEA